MGSRRERALRRLRVWGRLRTRRRVRLALIVLSLALALCGGILLASAISVLRSYLDVLDHV